MDGSLAEQAAAEAFGWQGDLTLFDARDSGDAVVFSESLGEHREAGFHQGTSGEIFRNQLADEGWGFVGDALSEQEAVFRVEERVGVGFVQTSQLEPLAGEVLIKAFGARIGEQAIDLVAEDFWPVQRAIAGRGEQGVVRRTVPKPIGEASSEGRVVGRRGEEEEFRGSQYGDVDAAHGVFEAILGVEPCLQEFQIRFDLRCGHIAAKRAWKEVGEEFAGVFNGLIGTDRLEFRRALSRREVEVHARQVSAEATDLFAAWRNDVAPGDKWFDRELAKEARVADGRPDRIQGAFDLEPIEGHTGADVLGGTAGDLSDAQSIPRHRDGVEDDGLMGIEPGDDLTFL